MKRQLLWAIPLLLVIGLIIKNWSWSVSREDVIGTYVNTSFSHVPCCVEAPHEPDTLHLLADGTMVSAFYGKGTWELERSGNGIDWSYPCEYRTGNADGNRLVQSMCGYSAGIDNRIGSSIKLILELDWDHHYRKIE